MSHPEHQWRPVVEAAADCVACDACGELLCPTCLERADAIDPHLQHDAPVHYADCACPGPHQSDEFEYRTTAGGRLEARPL